MAEHDIPKKKSYLIKGTLIGAALILLILGPDAPGNEPKFEDYFYLCCEGLNHEEAGVGRDQPAFDQMYIPPDPER